MELPGPSKRATPPRTLPSLLDDTSPPPMFDSRAVPFSPTSPGKRSPGRPKTMKEYEEDLINLKRENFNLKVRIFFMEQHRIDPNLPKDVEEIRNLYTDLKVEHEMLQKDLENKEDLLLNTYRALDAQKQQLESLKEEIAEKQDLQNRIEYLEKELKDYHLRFMETSVHLDDTNAMYAMTFGLNSKSEPNKIDNYSELKVKELENELIKEKERASMLEDKIEEMKEKHECDQRRLQQLQEQVESMEKDIEKTLQEKQNFKEEFSTELKKLEQQMQLKNSDLKQKENELEELKQTVTDREKRSVVLRNKLKETHEKLEQSYFIQTELQKKNKLIDAENTRLNLEVKHLQNQSGSRGSQSPSRRSSEKDRELCRHMKLKLQQLQLEKTELEKANSRSQSSVAVIQELMKQKSTFIKEIERLKVENNKLKAIHTGPSRGEASGNMEEICKENLSEKDSLISELKYKIEELNKIIYEKEIILQEFRRQSDVTPNNTQGNKTNISFDLKCEKEKEALIKELEDKNKEVESLKKELKKKTFNLQGLVNTELWDKNREIEKLNKVCERQHVELMSLQKQVRECHVTMAQERITNYVPQIALQSNLFGEDKENLQPGSDLATQIQRLTEEKRSLMRKVEELQERLMNTPERDTESLLVQTLRAEKDHVEKLRKEAVNACMLLTTRLQELADFLDSLLPTLCGKKRKYVQQAVERSRELSRSLSLAAEESSLLHCSAWTDLQPSLYVPLLPDISTIDFWSGEEGEEPFLGEDDTPAIKSHVELLPEQVTQNDGDVSTFHLEKNFTGNLVMKSVFNFDDQCVVNKEENCRLLDNNSFCGNIGNVNNGFVSDKNTVGEIQSPGQSNGVKSSNIGKITLTSKKKSKYTTNEAADGVDINKSVVKEGGISECETWSEPDRDVSYARMGLKEDPNNLNKSTQFTYCDTSETADSTPRSPSSRRASEFQRLQRKVRSLEQMNGALRSELVILHQLAPPAATRQDKSTSIELSRQGSISCPFHLLEEIKNQREKLEASLFHNDYIRRQLESTVSTLQRSQGNEAEKASLVRLKELTNQLEFAETELSELKLEKDILNKRKDSLQNALQEKCSELKEKQTAWMEQETRAAEQIKEVEEKYVKKCSEIEQKCTQLEQKALDLEKEKGQLLEKIMFSNQEISKLHEEIENYKQEGQKNKQLQEELNLQLQQIYRQKDDLQRVVADQEQLLADAERERQELATQLIARDREVAELQKRLSHVELTSNELEAALRSQLDIATHQCAQFEAKIRDLDYCNKDVVVDLQRRLDAARFAHSEAVLQYTRVANDNIRLQQEIRRKQHDPNQLIHIEKMKTELEHRVAELEAANTELETRLTSLNIVKPSMSDCETEMGSSMLGSPRRTIPPPLLMPSSPHHRSHDLTSDYLSDQDAALSSPQTGPSNLWYPVSPHSEMSASPDLGIESDHGRLSSLESQLSKVVSRRGTPVKDISKLEEENTQLRRNLQKTRHALEETLTQLTAANQHKRQYEAQLSAANQHKAKVERAICRQLHKTHNILKKARVNLEDDGKVNHS